MLDCELVLQDLETSEAEESENYEDYGFSLLPEHFLIEVFSQLEIEDIVSASYSCKRWYSIAHDDYLWKKNFQRDFKVDKKIGIKPGKHISLFKNRS